MSKGGQASVNGSRLRILVLASTYPRWANDHEPGFVHELSRRLADTMDVVVLAPHAPGAQQEEVLDGVRVLRYRYAPERWQTLVNEGGIVANLRRHPGKWLLVPGFVAMQAWSAWRISRRLRIDAIHAHWLIPQGLVAAMLAWLPGTPPPILVTSHGADLYSLNSGLLRRLKRFVVRSAAAATVVSTGMKGVLAELGARAEDVEVMSMGVDLSTRFVPDPAAERSASRLLFVGRLVEKKGLRYLLEAMPAIVQACPVASLTIAGFGPEEARLRAYADSLELPAGTIEFVGGVPQTQLPDLYRRAAVFVAPFVQAASGDREGLGLVLVEALGCGCPAVVSDMPATREVLDGHAQPLRVTPGSATEIAAAVIRLLTFGRDEGLGAVDDSLPTLREKFDWSAVAAAYSRLIRSVAADRV